MHLVEGARLRLGHPQHPRCNDPKTRRLEVRYDLSGFPRSERVGLYDGKCPAASHVYISQWFSCYRFRSSTTSIGRFATPTPFSSNACIFSAAVPAEPEMMAPA